MLAGMKLLLNWILSACALLLVASVYSGLQVHSFGSALWAVVVISGLPGIHRAIRKAVATISKPFDPGEVLEIVEETIGTL